MTSHDFVQSTADPCIFYHKDKKIFVGIYVDDIITVGTLYDAQEFRDNLRNHFNITQGGLLEWYLGVAFHRGKDGSITLDQTVYLKQKIEEFKQYIGKDRRSSPIPADYQRLLEDAKYKEISTQNFPYRKIIGSLMYAMLGTRPDIACAVSVLSQFLDKPKDVHIMLVKHLLQYLAANIDHKLVWRYCIEGICRCCVCK